MVKRKYFGTDGVRGLANTFPMTPDIALKLGAAAGRHFRKDQKQHRVVSVRTLAGQVTCLKMP